MVVWLTQGNACVLLQPQEKTVVIDSQVWSLWRQWPAFDSALTWPNAQRVCTDSVSGTGDLVTLNTRRQHEVLREAFAGAADTVWIGLRGPGSTNPADWTWTATNQTPTYTSWQAGQPDNAYGREGYVVQWSFSKEATGRTCSALSGEPLGLAESVALLCRFRRCRALYGVWTAWCAQVSGHEHTAILLTGADLALLCWRRHAWACAQSKCVGSITERFLEVERTGMELNTTAEFDCKAPYTGRAQVWCSPVTGRLEYLRGCGE